MFSEAILWDDPYVKDPFNAQYLRVLGVIGVLESYGTLVIKGPRVLRSQGPVFTVCLYDLLKI